MSAVPEEVLKYVAGSTKDDDPQETAEWLEALDGVLSNVGPDRAHYLIEKQIEFARVHGEHLPFSANTPYINTIPVSQQAKLPGDQDIEHRIRSPQRCTTSASTISGMRRRKTTAVTSCSHKAIRRRVSIRAHSCWAVSTKTSSTTSVRKSAATASRRIRTRG